MADNETIVEREEAMLALGEAAVAKLHEMVNGGESTEVQTAAGPVPSVKKWQKDNEVFFADAATRAELARDAAMASGAVYADTAAGLAATLGTGTENRYFNVLSADDDEYLILYRNESGTAIEEERYPSAQAVNNLPGLANRIDDIEGAYSEATDREDYKRQRVGLFTADSASFFGFAFELIGLTDSANYIDVHAQAVNANDKLSLRIISRLLSDSESVAAPGSLPGDVVIRSHEYPSSAFTDVATVQTIRLEFQDVKIRGDRIYLAEVKGLMADGGAGSLGFGRAEDAAESDVSAAGWFCTTVVGWQATTSSVARYSYAVGRVRRVLPVFVEKQEIASLPMLEALCVDSEVTDFSRWPPALMFSGTSLFHEWAFGVVPASNTVDRIELRADQVNYNETIELKLWLRPVASAYVGAPSAGNGDVLIATHSFLATQFGSTDGIQDIALDFPPVDVPADTYLVINVRGYAVGGAFGRLGMGRIDGVAGLPQIERGYYRQGSNWAAIAGGGASPALAVKLLHTELRIDGSRVVNLPESSNEPTLVSPASKHPGGVATRIFGGRMEYQFDNSTPKTFRTIFTVAQEFDWVRVIFGHGNGSAANIARFSIAPLATADYTAAGATWTAGKFSGEESGSIPARKGTRRAGLLVSDWIKVSSLPRTDDVNALPLLAVSAYMDTPEVVAMLGNAAGTDNFTNWAAHPVRPHVMRYNDGDCVLNPVAFTDATNRSTSPIIGLQYRARGQVVTVFAVGDSITDGRGTYLMGNWAFRACSELSDKAGIAYEYGNLGWSGCSTAQMLGRVEDYLAAGIVPDVGFVAAMSPNDISGAITDVAVLAGRQNTAAIIDLWEQAGCRPVLWTWLPTNAAVKDYGASDAKRVSFNGEIRAQSSRGRIVADFDAVLAGVTDGDGQVQMLAGSTTDGIHPNDTGEELMKPLAKSAIQVAAVIKSGSLVIS